MGLVVPSGPFRSRATELLWQLLAWGAIVVALGSFWMMARQGVTDLEWVLANS